MIVIEEVNTINENINKKVLSNINIASNIAHNAEILSSLRKYATLDPIQQIEMEEEIYGKLSYYWYANADVGNVRLFLYDKNNINSVNERIISMDCIKNSEVYEKLTDRSYAFFTNTYSRVAHPDVYEPDYESMAVFVKLTDATEKVYGYLCLDVSKKTLIDMCVKNDIYNNIVLIDANRRSIYSSDEYYNDKVANNYDVIAKQKVSAKVINDGSKPC